MTRVLVWKECREQGAVVIALLALGAGVLAAMGTFLDSPGGSDGLSARSVMPPARLALVMLTLAGGVVVGGSLFAGEREAGTFAFLDHLPASRAAVFFGKVLAGLGLTSVVAVGLIAAAAAAGVIGPRSALPGWAALIGAVAAAGFGWGTFGSVGGRNSLTACGVGLAMATTLGLLLTGAAKLALDVGWKQSPVNLGQPTDSWGLAVLVAASGLLFVPLPFAMFTYTGPDRNRWKTGLGLRPLDAKVVGGAVRTGFAQVGRTPVLLGLSRLWWLGYRQMRWAALLQAGLGLLLGLTLLIPGAPRVLVWPGITLLLGVLAGVATVADEQPGGAFRFWGERRLPVGRLWAMKVLGGLALILVGGGAALMPVAVELAAYLPTDRNGPPLIAYLFQSALLAESGFPYVTFLTAWPLYGLALTHLAALWFRKPLVAGAVGAMLGGTFAAVWVPSLVAGGLHLWQPFAPLVAALAVARLTAWAWVTDQLGTRPAVTRLAAGGTACVTLVAAGIGFRVLEVPDLAESRDHEAFAAALPTLDEKQAGRDVKRAVGQFNQGNDDVQATFRMAGLGGAPGGFAPGRFTAGGKLAAVPLPNDEPLETTVANVPQNGYPRSRPDVDRYVRLMSEWDAKAAEWARALGLFPAGPWESTLAEAAAKPTGVLEDPNTLTPFDALGNLVALRRMAVVYLARGLMSQRDGDPAAFARRLPVWLATLRTARHRSTAMPVLIALAMERTTYHALDRWLEQLPHRPDDLRAALAAVAAHDAADAFDPREVRLAGQVVRSDAARYPSRWLDKYLNGYAVARRAGDRQTNAEAELVAVAWAVPWERERLRRAVGLANVPGGEAQSEEALAGAAGASTVLELPLDEQLVADQWKVTAADRRAAILKLAIRLHHAERGQPPANLAVLVPAYLTQLPADPFDGNGFTLQVCDRFTQFPSGGLGSNRDAVAEPGQAVLGIAGLVMENAGFRRKAGDPARRVAWQRFYPVPPAKK